MIDSRRKFLRNAAGLMVPAVGLLTPSLLRAAPIVVNGPVSHAASGPWIQGLNFRSTLGYVTDGANEAFASGTVTYPQTTPQGNSVGWDSTTGINVRDRNAANDRRLAGCQFINTAVLRKYRVDLPATGDYIIRCAAGDESSGTGTAQIELYDNTTLLATIVNASPVAASFADATNTIYTKANWPGSNTGVTYTFASTICFFSFPIPAVQNKIAHLYLEKV